MAAAPLYLDVGQVMAKIRVPRNTTEISSEDLGELGHLCSQHVGKDILAGYHKALATFTFPQQGNIRCLLDTIHRMMKEDPTAKSAIIAELSNILTDVRCFPDHFLLLQRVCLFTGSRTAPSDELLGVLIRKLWEHLSSYLPSQLMQIVSARLFGNCADNMATHANACVSYALDRIHGLFGGTLLDDPNCPATPLVLAVVAEISRPFLTLDSLGVVVQSLCEDDPWAIVRRLLDDDDAAIAIAEAAAGGQGRTHALFKPEPPTFAVPLSAEEAHALGLLRPLLEEEEAGLHPTTLTLADLAVIREHFYNRPLYNHFFRMNFHILTCVASHVNPDDLTLVFYQCREDGNASPFMLSKFINCISFLQPHVLMAIVREDLALLSQPFEAYGSFMHFLAECNHLMLALLLEQQSMDFTGTWSLQNSIGYSWMHVLSQHKGTLFAMYLENLSEKDLRGLLAIMNPLNGRSVCYTYACCNATLFGDLAARNSIFRRLMGPIFNSEGWSACHHLAERYTGILRNILAACSAEEAGTILSLQNPHNKINVYYMMVTSKPDEFCTLVLERADLLPTLLALRSPEGWSAFHHLAEKHGNCIKRLMDHLDSASKIKVLNLRNAQRNNFPVCRMLCSQYEAFCQIMAAHADVRRWISETTESYHEGWSPMHVLAEHYGEALATFLAGLETQEALAFLSLRNVQTKLPVAYMFCSKQVGSLAKLIVQKPNLVEVVAPVHTQEGWSVFHHMAEKYGSQLQEMLKALDPSLARRVLAERSSSSQLPVCYMLCVHFPVVYLDMYRAEAELRDAMLLPTSEGWCAFHHLAEKHAPLLVGVLRSLAGKDAMEILRLANVRKNSLPVAHFFATINGALFLDALATLPEIRQQLLGLSDAEGLTVYHLFARKQPQGLKAFFKAVPEDDAMAVLLTPNLNTEEETVFETYMRQSNKEPAARTIVELASAQSFLNQL